MLARSNKGTWLPVLLSLGVKGVRVVIAHKDELGVRVNSKRSTCEKIQQSIWIFHFSLRKYYSNYREAKASPRGRFGGAFNSRSDRLVTFSINSLRARPRNISVNIHFG